MVKHKEKGGKGGEEGRGGRPRMSLLPSRTNFTISYLLYQLASDYIEGRWERKKKKKGPLFSNRVKYHTSSTRISSASAQLYPEGERGKRKERRKDAAAALETRSQTFV